MHNAIECQNQMDDENQNHQLKGASCNLNEWGAYTGNQDVIRIRSEGSVIKHLQHNNPAIRSSLVFIHGQNEIDWGLVGRHIGRNRHLKHLSLSLNTDRDDISLRAFCRGMVENQSIEALEVNFYVDEGEDLFRDLLPFFLPIVLFGR
jgi:hypothetical protein